MQKLVLRKTYWQFFNSGTRYQLDPEKPVQTVGGQRMLNGDVHRALVREWNRPDVYLLNEQGELVT